MSDARRGTVPVAIGVGALIAAGAVIGRQIEDQRYATTAVWHEGSGWALAGAASIALAACAAASSWTGRSGFSPSALLALWVGSFAVAWEAGPMWLRSVCFAGGALAPLAAMRWSEQLVSIRLTGWWWSMAFVVPAGALLAALTLYQPWRDGGCTVVCGPNPWALTHVRFVAELPQATAVVVALGLGLLMVRQLLRRSPADVGAVVVVLSAVVAAVCVPLTSQPSTRPSLVSVGAASLSLLVLSATCGRRLVDAGRRRRRLAELVTALSTAPQPDVLEAALTRALGGRVSISYPDPSGVGSVDVLGLAANRGVDDRVEVRSRGAAVAWLHGPGVRRSLRSGGPPDLEPSTALLVENTSVVARLRVQIERARSTRAAVVGASDAARLHLERDLHDGAQQLVLALALDLRLLADSCPPGSPEHLRAEAARDEVATALTELRSVAHGMHPAALDHGGFTEALDELSELTGVPITAEGTTELGPDQHEAVYRLIESVVGQVATSPSASVMVSIYRAAGTTEVVVDAGGAPVLIGVEKDRLAALGATLDEGPPLIIRLRSIAGR